MHDSLLYQSRFVNVWQNRMKPVVIVFIVAHSILENIDENIDACENFYQFTCSAWIRNAARQTDGNMFALLEMQVDQFYVWFSVVEQDMLGKIEVQLKEDIAGKTNML